MDPLLPDLRQATTAMEQAQLARAQRDLQSATQPSAAPDPNAPAANDLSGLQRVARQFESLFFGQLIRSMRETVPENGFWGQGGGTQIYRQLHDQALADRMADSGSLGIAEMIVRQFHHAVPGAGEAPPPPRVGPPPPLAAGTAAYRRQGQVGERIAGMVRLRHQADAVGGAAADTLDRYQSELSRAVDETELDPALVLAVTVQESGGDPRAVSPKGARGLMQLMPGTARELGVDDPTDPGQNLHGGARYLARMLRRYDGDVDLALAAYNAGPGAVDRAGGKVPDFPETRRYVEAVKRLAVRLGADLGTKLDGDLANDSPGTP